MVWPVSNFPGALDDDAFMIDKGATSDAEASDINGAYDAIRHIEAKLGADSSSVITSIDYLLKNTASVDPGHKHSAAKITDLTATASEINLACDGILASAAEINLACDGILASAAEINIACYLTVNKFFETGGVRKIWFYEATAPLGWTIVTVAAEALLAVAKTGTYTVGGSQQGHWEIDIAEMPAHAHTYTYQGHDNAYNGYNEGWTPPYAQHDYPGTSTSSVGSGASTYRPLASVGLICSKN